MVNRRDARFAPRSLACPAFFSVPAIRRTGILVVALAAAAACDKVPLTAPTGSSITVTAGTRTLALGGSTEVQAFVTEQAGTPVQNGTTVRFVASLGRVEPAEAQTRNGVAVATFFAGETSGVAEVRAFSGGAGAGGGTGSGTGTGTGTGSGTGGTASNTVQIAIGAASAGAVSVSASPSTVPPTGGTAAIIASVVDASGNRLPGVPVVFSASAGSLSASTATTDANGDARVTLTTSTQATVTARVGSGEGARTATVTVNVATANNISLSVNPENPNLGQPVTLTITATVGANNIPPNVTVDWGDGAQENVGLVNGSRTIAHAYQRGGNFIIRVTGTANGETITASIGVFVNAGALALSVSASPSPADRDEDVTFTATVGGEAVTIVQYRWIIDSNTPGEDQQLTTAVNQITVSFATTGTKRVQVTATASDGRTATAQTQVVVQ